MVLYPNSTWYSFVASITFCIFSASRLYSTEYFPFAEFLGLHHHLRVLPEIQHILVGKVELLSHSLSENARSR